VQGAARQNRPAISIVRRAQEHEPGKASGAGHDAERTQRQSLVFGYGAIDEPGIAGGLGRLLQIRGG